MSSLNFKLILTIILFCNYSWSLASDPKLQPMGGCLDCFNFVAPTILGAENINPAEIGLIVYDSYYNSFRGYNAAGAWAKLSNEKSVRTLAAGTTLLSVDDVVSVNASAGSVTIGLPSAATVPGKDFLIKKTDSSSNLVTIDPSSTETIDGVAIKTLGAKNEAIQVVSDGTGWLVTQKTYRTPTQQKFTSGSGTYTTPAGVSYIRIRMVGGGGGGGGGIGVGGAPITGTSGNSTTFGTSFLTCGGGTGGGSGSAPGGGATIGSGATGMLATGGRGGGFAAGGSATMYGVGGSGGNSAFGGAGVGIANAAGTSAESGTGAGGGGGGVGNVADPRSASGGGAGGYIDAMVTNPSSSYSYTVGSGGPGASGGTNGFGGGAGGSGIIIIDEFYQ